MVLAVVLARNEQGLLFYQQPLKKQSLSPRRLIFFFVISKRLFQSG